MVDFRYEKKVEQSKSVDNLNKEESMFKILHKFHFKFSTNYFAQNYMQRIQIT